MTQETLMKTVLFTLALLAQMTVQAAVPDRSVDTTTASASTSNGAAIVAQASTGGSKEGRQTTRPGPRSSTKR
jgi:hypothetical protein